MLISQIYIDYMYSLRLSVNIKANRNYECFNILCSQEADILRVTISVNQTYNLQSIFFFFTISLQHLKTPSGRVRANNLAEDIAWH